MKKLLWIYNIHKSFLRIRRLGCVFIRHSLSSVNFYKEKEMKYKNIRLKELENDNLLHFSSIPQRAKWIVDKKSGDNKAIKDTRKKVLSFISDYCAAIFIDEAQDIDDDVKLIIEALDKAGISIFLYGDPKQDVKGFGNYRALINNAQSVHYDSCCHRCPQGKCPRGG